MTTRPAPSARATAHAAAALAGLFLAACGGGGPDMPPAPPPAPAPAPLAAQLPASAAATIASWEAFAIAQAPNDRIEPLRLDLVTSVPTSETASPIVLP
jgi:hypothetical protein